jgi:hypothetical protein
MQHTRVPIYADYNPQQPRPEKYDEHDKLQTNLRYPPENVNLHAQEDFFSVLDQVCPADGSTPTLSLWQVNWFFYHMAMRVRGPFSKDDAVLYRAYKCFLRRIHDHSNQWLDAIRDPGEQANIYVVYRYLFPRCNDLAWAGFGNLPIY